MIINKYFALSSLILLSVHAFAQKSTFEINPNDASTVRTCIAEVSPVEYSEESTDSCLVTATQINLDADNQEISRFLLHYSLDFGTQSRVNSALNGSHRLMKSYNNITGEVLHDLGVSSKKLAGKYYGLGLLVAIPYASISGTLTSLAYVTHVSLASTGAYGVATPIEAIADGLNNFRFTTACEKMRKRLLMKNTQCSTNQN